MGRIGKCMLLSLIVMVAGLSLITYLTLLLIPYSVLFSMNVIWPSKKKFELIEKMEKPLELSE